MEEIQARKCDLFQDSQQEEEKMEEENNSRQKF
jgi:hypothetical protein